MSAAIDAALGGDWYDEGDLLDGAVEQVDALAGRRIVLHLPVDLEGRRARFLRALGAVAAIEVLLESGSDGPDPAVAAACGGDPQAGPRPGAGPDARPPVRAPERIITTTDADDEVRHAVRRIVDAARHGVPLERMAVLWPATQPYARLVEHHLDAAGVAWNGRGGTEVVERLVPRLVLDLLDIDRRGLDRPPLFDVLADVPARDADGLPLPTARWERVSRYAGVVREADWAPRLGAIADDERWGADATGLAGFVDELRARLGHPRARRTWTEWAEWADQQVEHWLGRRTLDHLDEPEFRAWEALGKALERLRHLDVIGPAVNRATFRAALGAELDDAPTRAGRVGDGVTVGPLAGSVGLDLDVAVVLGGCEGTLPPPPPADPLVSDHDRRAAGLPTSDRRAHHLGRRLNALLDSAAVTVTAPRGDLRAGAERPLSRWLAPWATSLRVDVDSHVAGLAMTSFPATDHEHRLRALLAHVGAGGELGAASNTLTDPVLQRGLRLRAGRRAAVVTAFDGDLTSVAVPAIAQPIAPTRLELWASCPHAYFVRYVLGIEPVEEPASLLSISGADRGSALHRALDDLHRAVLDGRLPQPTTTGWTAAHVDLALAAFDAAADRVYRRGRTGRAAYWAVERQAMRDDLAAFLVHDGDWLRERRAAIAGSEVEIGSEHPVSVSIGDGRQLAVWGRIDRVVDTPTGAVVTDFKTGSDVAFRAIADDDPTLGVTHFQLATYALAVRDAARPTVHAEYAMFAKGKYRRHGFTLDESTIGEVEAAFATVVAGLESGLYPPVPERPGFRIFVACRYCEPDGLGTGERWSEWERKRGDPRLARWFGDADSGPGDGAPAEGTSGDGAPGDGAPAGVTTPRPRPGGST